MSGRVRRVARRAREEAAFAREWRAELGLGGVVRERVKAHLGMSGIDDSVARATWATEAAVAGAVEEAAAQRARADALEAELGVLAGRLAALEAAAPGVAAELAAARSEAATAVLAAKLDLHERLVAVELGADDVLVSVLLPTRSRPEHLRRAIASVLAQVHQRWELLVVDTGDDPGTAAVLASFDDPRIRTLRAPGERGPGGRNAALEVAAGELIAYLDDDNVLQPLWLRAVAAAALRHPERGAFYGARVHEALDAGGEPLLVLRELDPLVFAHENLIDTGTLAHRASLGLRWRTDILGGADWELVTRLVAEGHAPLPVYVRAVVYTTSAPGRVCDMPQALVDREVVAALARDRMGAD